MVEDFPAHRCSSGSTEVEEEQPLDNPIARHENAPGASSIRY
jgi:hypothetical protein